MDVNGSPSERSLRTFLNLLEKTPGEGVARVEREVNPAHELPTVVKRMEGVDDRPVFFENVAGHVMPVVMNLYGSKRRIAMALGLSRDTHPIDVMEHYLKCLATHVPPSEVGSGPVKEVVQTGEEADLGTLPIGIHAAQQGGPYMGSGVMLVRDPESGAVNAGIYRLMVQGPRQFTVSVDPGHDLGKVIAWGRNERQPIPFAVVIGADPTLYLASQAKVPISHDCFELVGAFSGEPAEIVRCETNDLMVPASSEIVLEGVIPPGETAAEGPYGEFSYFYGSDPSATLCNITAISRRQGAIFADIHPVHREHRCLWLHPGREASLLQRLRALVPSVRSVHIPLEGAAMVALISIDKSHEGDPKRALLFTLSSDVFIKHAVIVDSSIDIHDPARVVWALVTRFQPDRDAFIVSGARGYSEDPSGYRDGLSSKIGYDATAPLEGFPVAADVLAAEYKDLDPGDYVVNPENSSTPVPAGADSSTRPTAA